MKTNNPMFDPRKITQSQSGEYNKRSSAYGRDSVDNSTMTMTGTINKALILLSLLFVSAGWSYSQQKLGLIMPMVILAFILALVTNFKMQWAHVTAPAYALCEGVALGAISHIFDMRYPGIASQAVLGTTATFAVMFFSYRSKMIQATPGLTRGIMIATMGIALTYLVSFVLSMFGVTGVSGALMSSSPISILFSVVVVGVASLNLILDFNFIEQAVARKAGKEFEWFSAFALMVTLVWLYMEILRLLSKLRGRD